MQLRRVRLSPFLVGLIILVLLLAGSTQLFAAQGQPTAQSVPALAARTPVPSSPGVEGPLIGEPIAPASFDGDVRRLPKPRAPSQSREALRPLRRRAPGSQAPFRTTSLPPVRQAQPTAVRMPAPLQGFNGLDAITGGGWVPPDPNGDVGLRHYVQAVNIAVGIYSKTGTQLAAFSFNSLFGTASAPCNNSNHGDPIVLYDPTVDRWVVSDFAWSNSSGPFYECIAVSKTGDPVSGGWWLYRLLAHNTYLNDYPKLGVWSDGYYMSANLFNASEVFQGVRVWALDRSTMINGAPTLAVAFDLPCSTSCYGSLLPSNLRGIAPPPGTPNFFASVDEPNVFHLWKFDVDWVTPSNSTFTGPTNLTVADFVMPCGAATIPDCVPEQGGESVDALGDRLMMQLQYRRIGNTESLWANHTVTTSVGSPTGIRWYEIRDPAGTPAVYQQGTYQPDSDYRWMGSLAVDRDGNMAVGYSVSSASMYPAIRYSGRLAADPLGTLAQGEASLIVGTGSQSGGFNRWGDYSAMTVDPVDDCTFWYTNEYYTTTGYNWQTRIGSFKFPGCSYLQFLPVILKDATP